MAQIPWEVLSSRPAEYVECMRMIRSCAAFLRKTPASEIQGLTIQLEQILENTQSCNGFHKINARGTVQLHPSFLSDPNVGIHSYLSFFLLKFLPEFEGIWVSFGKPRLLGRLAHLPDAEQFGFLCCDIQVEILVFKPLPGTLIVGVVNLIRPTHIGLLVNGFLNATLGIASIRKDYAYSKNHAYFAGTTSRADIIPEALVAFFVTRYQYSADGSEILLLEGSLGDREKTGVVDSNGKVLGKQETVVGGNVKREAMKTTKLRNSNLRAVDTQNEDNPPHHHSSIPNVTAALNNGPAFSEEIATINEAENSTSTKKPGKGLSKKKSLEKISPPVKDIVAPEDSTHVDASDKKEAAAETGKRYNIRSKQPRNFKQEAGSSVTEQSPKARTKRKRSQLPEKEQAQ